MGSCLIFAVRGGEVISWSFFLVACFLLLPAATFNAHMVLLYDITGLFRQARLLALLGARPRRGSRAALWLPSLHWASDRGRLLL